MPFDSSATRPAPVILHGAGEIPASAMADLMVRLANTFREVSPTDEAAIRARHGATFSLPKVA